MTDSPSPPLDPTWGVCRFCAVAVPPGVAKCTECGAPDPIASADLPKVRGGLRRRIQVVNFLRSLIVVAVILGLAYLMISLVLTGPPVVNDPLTTTGTYTIGPGNYTVISGEITGGDFVVGNFTTTSPVGTNLQLSVYNSTDWVQFFEGHDPVPLWSMSATPEGQIVYSANYTDVFYFVFTNPYAPSTNLTIQAYIATEYESNVGDDGFA